tara:strand:- start:4010 stop:4396 length:387 start_codon:yes stop_codon:yes gene_type:complete
MINLKLVLLSLVLIIFLGCSGKNEDFPSKSFRTRLSEGDNHMGKSINYFESWKSNFQIRYLRLAERHTISAINLFSHLEFDTSPRISEYYVVRARRTQSCRLLAELQFEASNKGFLLDNTTPQGCIYF